MTLLLNLEERFQDFLRSFLADGDYKYRKRLAQVALSGSRSLIADFDDLIAFDPELARWILDKPDEYAEALDRSAWAQLKIEDPEYAEMIKRLHVRYRKLPEKHPLRKIGSENIGKLLMIDGIIVRSTAVKPLLIRAAFQCRKCNALTYIDQAGILMRGPGVCPHCRSKIFEFMEKQSTFMNSQEIRIQERPEDLPPGQLPRAMDIKLTEDLVDIARPGDRVSITGVARALQEFAGRKARLRTFELLLDANYVDVVGKEVEVVEITPEDERQIRELAKDPFIHRKLIASLAPSIYGYGDIKESVLYLLFGGVPKRLPDGITIRSEVNVMLVGDPGCLVADERIVLGDGTIAKIGEVGKRHLEPLKLQVLTGEGGAKRAYATRYHIYRNQPVIELVTESGKSIKGTYNHPLLAVRKEYGGLAREWKRLDEFKVGDRVATVTGFPCTVKKYVNTAFKPQHRRYGPKFRGKLPGKVSPELGALLGYMLGDGWAQRYRAGFIVAKPEADILPRLLSIVTNLFGTSPRVDARKLRAGRTVPIFSIVIGSEDIASNLAFLREKRVPNIILASGNSVVAAFLKWLFEADGCVFEKGHGSRAIQLKAKDVELLRDVQVLLLRFGIHSRIIGNALLIRRGEDIIKFGKKIGFASKKKRRTLKNLCAAADRFQRVHPQRSERIVKIIEHGPADVYDIEVPDGHRFIANGIISHNTAKSQLLQYVSRIAPRGLYTSGRGTTAAGLTAAVLREKSGGMVLEAGALVLADKGIACIDEIDKMRPEDRVAIHEALEQHSYHPSTEILLASGQKVKIGSLVDRYFEEHAADRVIGKDCEILPLARNISVITTPDFHTFKVVSANRVSRHVAPDRFIEITYSNGRTVIVTPEHPTFVYRSAGIQTVPASEVKVGDFAPGIRRLEPLPLSRELVIPTKAHHNEKQVNLPSSMNSGLGTVLGYLISEGYSYSGSAAEIGFSNTNKMFINEMNTAMQRTFGIRALDYRHMNRTQRYISSRLYRYCHENFRTMFRRAPYKRVPPSVMSAPVDVVRTFLRAAFKGDGCVESEAVSLSTASLGLAEDYQDLLLTLGISTRLFRGNRSFKVYVTGDSLCSFVQQIADREDHRYAKVKRLLERSMQQRGHDVVPVHICRRIIALERMLGLRDDGYFYKHLQRGDGITRHTLSKYIQLLDSASSRMKDAIAKANSIRSLRDSLHWSQVQTAHALGLTRSNIDYAERNGYDETKRQDTLRKLRERALDASAETRTRLEELKAINVENIRWLRVKGVRVLPNRGRLQTRWVYDLTVEPTHNFVSHGVVLHNTVSIAKGGIVATLNARAAVLAAANPSLGRYDPYRNITDNINLPVTLLSRFDLLFIMKDVPEPDSDSRMSDHILTLHRMKSTPEEPPLPPETLRKYIAYAKRIEPVLTEEAVNEIRQYYLKMRSLSGATESPVAITPRQLEALVRLAEARARSFLRDRVEAEDARAIIRLMTISLQDVGIDTTTGKIDIDVIMTGKPKSLRDKMQVVLSTFADLEKQLGIVEEPTVYQALSRKVDITDDEARRLVNQLVKEGILYSPKPGHLKRTAA